MKNMIMITVLLTATVAAMAQSKEVISSEDKALLMTQRMKEEGLIDEKQFDEIYQVNLKAAKKKAVQREERKSFMEKQRVERQQIDAERMAELKELLNEEQLRKLKILHAKHKIRRGRHFGHPGWELRKDRLAPSNGPGKMR